MSLRKELYQILAKHTGQTLKTIQNDTERDNFMSGDEATEYGLIDTVLHERSVLPEDVQKETGKESE